MPRVSRILESLESRRLLSTMIVSPDGGVQPVARRVEAIGSFYVVSEERGVVQLRLAPEPGPSGQAADTNVTAQNVAVGSLNFPVPEPSVGEPGKNATIGNPAAGSLTYVNAARPGHYLLPTIQADGSVDLIGTGYNDVITVDRPNDPTADLDDGETDFEIWYDQKGNRVVGQGNLSQYMTGDFLESEREELASLEKLRDEARAAGDHGQAGSYERQAEGYRDRIAFGEFFRQKFLDGKFIRYTLAGVYDFFVEMSDDQAANARLTIDAGAGKDKVTIAKSLPFNAYINGGSGSDILIGGKRRAHLVGGGGNDRLISRSIRGGSLDGGKGADRYYNTGGAEVDLIVRKDGDKVITDPMTITVTRAGTFSMSQIMPTSEADAAQRNIHYQTIEKARKDKQDLLA